MRGPAGNVNMMGAGPLLTTRVSMPIAKCIMAIAIERYSTTVTFADFRQCSTEPGARAKPCPSQVLVEQERQE